MEFGGDSSTLTQVGYVFIVEVTTFSANFDIERSSPLSSGRIDPEIYSQSAPLGSREPDACALLSAHSCSLSKAEDRG